jgi:diguanylate cyclase (GGDEF)-like protein/PAS domain S-box-containing protein
MTRQYSEFSNTSPELLALNRAFATARYTVDGKLTDSNHRFTRLTGYGRDELVGREIAMFFPASQQRRQSQTLWEALRKGEKRDEIELFTTKAGAEIWLNSRYVPLKNAQGTVDAVVQIARDASKQQARESDGRGQIAAIDTTLGVVHFALDGTVLDANENFLRAVGYGRDAVVGRHHGMFVDPEHARTAEYQEFWAALARGEHKSGEYRRLHQDGSDVWLRSLYSPILDLAGRPIKVVEYATDITQEKLRQADFQSQIAAIHKSSCVITFDTHGTILEANDLFLAATGYTLDEVRGRHHRLFVEASFAHGSEYAAFWNDLRKGLHRSGQYKRLGKGGREVWLQATYNPIFDSAGRVAKIVKYATVVTEERLLQAEHQGQIAAIHNAQCVIAFELDGTVIDANENFLKATGYRFAEVRGQPHSMFVDSQQADSAEYRAFWSALASGQHRAGEYRRVAKGGREIWLQATYNPIFDMSGRPFKIVKYATEITAEKRRQADIQGQIEAIDRSTGVVTFALDGAILEANENFLAMVGYRREELRGRHHSVLVERHIAAGAEYTAFWAKLRAGNHHSGLYKRIGKDGREVWIQASYNPILDPNGKPSKVVKYASDVTSNVLLAQAFEDAKRQAHHDAATSLPNRIKLSSFLETHLAGPAAGMVVFYIDLDRFKAINDAYGHHVGDRILGELADRMRRVLREDQMIARVGGDEFVVAAPAMPTDAVERFCKNLFDAVSAPVHHEGEEIVVSMSMGIAAAPADGTQPDDLLRAADAALNRSKQNGRAQYTFYASEMNDKLVQQRRLGDEMRHSLSAGQFFLEYQPRFDARTGRIRSAEALVRWAHPERGRISPAEFIPLAERNGLIVPLGDWILRTACATALGWDEIGVSVNVSPAQFRDFNLVEKVKACLEETGLPASRLELEITEGVLMDDASRASRVLNELKALGVRLSMDDFGTGYSSLSYLRSFPFDVIKIDRSFIRDLDVGPNGRSLVQAILGLGRALGLSVTAEGVETDAQLATLISEECDEIQGFLLARPLSEAQFGELLTTGTELHDRWKIERRLGCEGELAALG